MKLPHRINPITRLLIGIAFMLLSLGGLASDIAGDWSGDLQTPGGKLVFVLEVTRADGQLSARAQSPSQSERYFAVDTFVFDRDRIHFTIDALNIQFEGRLSRDRKIISGDFRQGPLAMDLSLDRKPAESRLSARPQTSVAPFDYRVEEVEVVNAAADITLSGTLTRPNGPIKATAVMITGSGPQDRDESILRHKPFAVIADHLSGRGYAVLRLDDRGFGKSTGVFATATSEDFASDTNAAVDYLKDRADIPPDTIGLIGHSEGGMVASMVASRREDLAFVVMLAAPGVDIVDLYIEQRSNIFRSMGVPSPSLEKIKQLDRAVFEDINRLPAGAAVEEETLKAMRQISRAAGLQDPDAIDRQVGSLAKTYTGPWFRYFLKFDPEPHIKGIKVPVLALNGSLDIQVSAAQNLGGIRRALTEAGNHDYRAVELEGLNHLFQTAETGAISEYEQIEETIAPEALGILSDWLGERFEG